MFLCLRSLGIPGFPGNQSRFTGHLSMWLPPHVTRFSVTSEWRDLTVFHIELIISMSSSSSQTVSSLFHVELIVSDSELAFPHIFVMFYMRCIYYWRRINQYNMNIIKKMIVIKCFCVQSLKNLMGN